MDSGIRKDIPAGRRLRKSLAKTLRRHRTERGREHVATCYRTWGRHYQGRYGQ